MCVDAAALRAEGLLGKQSARVVEKKEEEGGGGGGGVGRVGGECGGDRGVDGPCRTICAEAHLRSDT